MCVCVCVCVCACARVYKHTPLYIYIYDLLCCIPETNTTLYINYQIRSDQSLNRVRLLATR